MTPRSTSSICRLQGTRFSVLLTPRGNIQLSQRAHWPGLIPFFCQPVFTFGRVLMKAAWRMRYSGGFFSSRAELSTLQLGPHDSDAAIQIGRGYVGNQKKAPVQAEQWAAKLAGRVGWLLHSPSEPWQILVAQVPQHCTEPLQGHSSKSNS